MIQKFTVNDFEGPLDLLLHLIRSSKMDIYNINVESITKQYIDFINASKDMSIDLLPEDKTPLPNVLWALRPAWNPW